jgi:hypothetical protein
MPSPPSPDHATPGETIIRVRPWGLGKGEHSALLLDDPHQTLISDSHLTRGAQQGILIPPGGRNGHAKRLTAECSRSPCRRCVQSRSTRAPRCRSTRHGGHQ